ncbi:MAG TPA: iron ABC transporter permease [Burkholderiales bacterium]|nr:iron ABC transporter permease [Burkholderiales bacterium]
MRRLGILGGMTLVIGVLLALPVLYVLSSVLSGGGETWSHLAETALARYVGNTLLLLTAVAWGVVSIGVVSAWLITTYRFPGRDFLEWGLMLPLAVPAYVMAYAYTDWLEFAGPVQSSLRALTGWGAREYWFPEVRSLSGAAVIMSFAFYPYVYLIARTAFHEMSRSAMEAGRLAGYGSWGAFWLVALPLARPAIVAGASLALMETLADFGTVSYFSIEVFTTGIFRAWLSMGDATAAAQLSACLLAFVVLLLGIERASRGRAAYAASPARKPEPPQRLAGRPALLALAACAAPVVFGFALPALLLARLAWQADTGLNARLAVLVANSFSVAGLTALIAVVLAAVMAYAARTGRSRVVTAVKRAAGLGYAVPGAVIAVGVLVPIARLDNRLAGWIEQAFGVQLGLLLTGTLAALIYAYLVRLLAVALQTIDAGLAKIRRSMEDAARSLGTSPAGALARVHAPLLAPSLATASLLVFVDVLKELPATFALRPFNFDTLAIAAYNLAKDERLAEAATPSLVIVLVGLAPVIYVSRRYFQPARSKTF